MLKTLRNRQKGFTLIELLIVVAIIGIIAAILIPNFLDALHKGRQKRTMGDIRNAMQALGNYYTENTGAAAAGATTIAIADYPALTAIDDLEAALLPNYATALPTVDGWGNTLEYYIALTDIPAGGAALVRAMCRDGAFDGDTYTSGGFEPNEFGQDIVFADGAFIRFPNTTLTT